jgi:hypothetical protein
VFFSRGRALPAFGVCVGELASVSRFQKANVQCDICNVHGHYGGTAGVFGNTPIQELHRV